MPESTQFTQGHPYSCHSRSVPVYWLQSSWSLVWNLKDKKRPSKNNLSPPKDHVNVEKSEILGSQWKQVLWMFVPSPSVNQTPEVFPKEGEAMAKWVWMEKNSLSFFSSANDYNLQKCAAWKCPPLQGYCELACTPRMIWLLIENVLFNIGIGYNHVLWRTFIYKSK